MTALRRDGNDPSEFSAWTRTIKELDSLLGFRAYNIDFMWGFDSKFILIEEKRFTSILKPEQKKMFCKLDRMLRSSKEKGYGGFWILRFENTNPEDGKIYLSKLPKSWVEKLFNPEREITKEQLIKFLKLEWL